MNHRILICLSLLLLGVLPLHAETWEPVVAEDLSNCVSKPELNHWSVADGVLTGANTPAMKGSVLWTEKQFGNFVLEGQFKFEGIIDSGIFVKGPRYQVNLGHSSSLKVDRTASLYAPKDGKGKYPGLAEGVDDLLKVGEWNDIRIEADGAWIRVALNGTPVLAYETLEMPESGPVGFQIHAKKHMTIQFRDVRVMEK